MKTVLSGMGSLYASSALYVLLCTRLAECLCSHIFLSDVSLGIVISRRITTRQLHETGDFVNDNVRDKPGPRRSFLCKLYIQPTHVPYSSDKALTS